VNPSLVSPPPVGKLRALKLPAIEERKLKNGLRVVVARKPGVPLVEARLAVPLARNGSSGDVGVRRLFANALITGTSNRSALKIAEDLQSMGASLDTGADSDDLSVYGSVLSTQVAPFLDLMAEVVTDPVFPDDETAIMADRTAQEIMLTLSQPSGLAQIAFAKRMFGKHPYGAGLPKPESVMKIGRSKLADFHTERIVPKGAVLVLVGDITPKRGLDLAEQAFGSWKGRSGVGELPEVAPLKAGPVELVHREGSVQATIRTGRFGLPPEDADYPKLLLANLIFGGYFAARLSDNIREDKGYTYGIYSSLQNFRRASLVAVGTDVATDVTVATLVELHYEMGRMVALPPKPEELEGAKKYQAGTLAMSVNTQSYLASQLLALLKRGQSVERLKELPKEVEQVTAEDVQEISSRFLGASGFATVIVGDADVIGPKLGSYMEVKRAR
jgi:zinc protease